MAQSEVTLLSTETKKAICVFWFVKIEDFNKLGLFKSCKYLKSIETSFKKALAVCAFLLLLKSKILTGCAFKIEDFNSNLVLRSEIKKKQGK